MTLTAATAGELLVRLRHDALGWHAAAELRRPQTLVAALAGKSTHEFLGLLPLLFPLCGLAHGVAALRAIESARGARVEARHERAREIVARADAVAMHVWRLALDWPDALGVASSAGPVAAARRVVQHLPNTLYPRGDWLAPGGGALVSPAPDLHGVLEQLRKLVAELDPAAALERMLVAVARRFDGDSIALRTRLQQRLHEQQSRLESDLSESAAMIEGDRALSQTGHGRKGEGVVGTARGPLRYWVELDGDRVMKCRSSAPTDVVFAPGSEALDSFAAMRVAGEPVPAARLIAAAYDPCVPVRIEIEAGTRA
jgi:Ni,Fe-hydrogenase I large subunit